MEKAKKTGVLHQAVEGGDVLTRQGGLVPDAGNEMSFLSSLE